MNFIVSLVIYPFDVMVSMGESDETLFAVLKSVSINEDEFHLSQYENIGKARYCLFTTGQSLIRIKKIPKNPEEFGYLQHEIFHCASSILWRMGFKLKIKTSDEAYSYLIQYLTEQIYTKIKLKP